MAMATQSSSNSIRKRRYGPFDPSLPEPWRAIIDGATGYLYFWNPVTNVTQYQRPNCEHDDQSRINVVEVDSDANNYDNYRERVENSCADVYSVGKDSGVRNDAKDRERISLLVKVVEENSYDDVVNLVKGSEVDDDVKDRERSSLVVKVVEDNSCVDMDDVDKDGDAKDRDKEREWSSLVVKEAEENIYVAVDDVDKNSDSNDEAKDRERERSSLVVKEVEENSCVVVGGVAKDSDANADAKERKRERSSLFVKVVDEESCAHVDSVDEVSETNDDAKDRERERCSLLIKVAEEDSYVEVSNVAEYSDVNNDAKEQERGQSSLFVKVVEKYGYGDVDDVVKDSGIDDEAKGREQERGRSSPSVMVIDEKDDDGSAGCFDALISTSKEYVVDEGRVKHLCEEDDSVNLGTCNEGEKEDWKLNEEGSGELDNRCLNHRLIEVSGDDQNEGKQFCTDYGIRMLVDNGNDWDRSMQCSSYNAAQMAVENRHDQEKSRKSDRDAIQVAANNGNVQDKSMQSSSDYADQVVEDNENDHNKPRKAEMDAPQVVDSENDRNNLVQYSKDHAFQMLADDGTEQNKCMKSKKDAPCVTENDNDQNNFASDQAPTAENNENDKYKSMQSSNNAPQVVVDNSDSLVSSIMLQPCYKRLSNDKVNFDPCKRPRYAPADASLPKPWRALVDGNTGYLYFWNPITKVTQYERPIPPVIQPTSVEAMSSHLEDKLMQASNECTLKVNGNDQDKSMQCSSYALRLTDSSTSGFMAQSCRNINADACKQPQHAPPDPSLPKPWRALVDVNTGYVYFWNPVTKVIQYKRPYLSHAQQSSMDATNSSGGPEPSNTNHLEDSGDSFCDSWKNGQAPSTLEHIVSNQNPSSKVVVDKPRVGCLCVEEDSVTLGTYNEGEEDRKLPKEDGIGELHNDSLYCRLTEVNGDDLDERKQSCYDYGTRMVVDYGNDRDISMHCSSHNAAPVVVQNWHDQDKSRQSKRNAPQVVADEGNDQDKSMQSSIDNAAQVMEDHGNDQNKSRKPERDVHDQDKSMQSSGDDASQLVEDNGSDRNQSWKPEKNAPQMVNSENEMIISMQSSSDDASQLVEDNGNDHNKSQKPERDAPQMVNSKNDRNKLMQHSNDHASQVVAYNGSEQNKYMKSKTDASHVPENDNQDNLANEQSLTAENNENYQDKSLQSSSYAPQAVANNNDSHGSGIMLQPCNKSPSNDMVKFEPCKRPRYALADTSLPKPWRALVDGNTGYLYFWNPITKVTQYERPVPPVIQPTSVEAMSSHFEDENSPLQASNECTPKVNGNDQDKFMQCSSDALRVADISDSCTSGFVAQPCRNINADASRRPQYAPPDPSLPKPWRALIDGNTGYVYFWNPVTKVTQYERPDLHHAQPSSMNATSSSEGLEPSNTNHLEDSSDPLYGSMKNAQLPSISEHNVSNQNSPAKVASSTESDHGQHEIIVTGSSTIDNIDEWKWKLSTLLCNETEQEIVSKERKDRRDYEQLAALAESMCLYSRQYATVVVFSKVPLPNYRSDLDDKRPQREVSVPTYLQREVEASLEAYLALKRPNQESFPTVPFSRSISTDSFGTGESLLEKYDTQTSSKTVSEKVLRLKSMQLRDQQQAWQESLDGQKMLEFRKSLPAYKEKDALLNALSQNKVIIVSGETGCGKTTQLPQYILESEIDAARGATCSIICTQPRRISAISVSERVAAERGEKLGESVGYKVRLEGEKGRDTRLLFCTTGILLRRLLVDRNLKGVTHVVVDEIHERGMNEDFLLVVLKDLLPRRPDLRLILMSATLNAELFSSYFGGAPMIHIPGFTYPVCAHFLENVLEVIGHKLTPYNQIDDYGQEKSWKMQKQALRKRKSQIASVVDDALEAADFKQYSPRTRDSLSCWNPDSIGFNLVESLLCHICERERPGAVLVFMTGWDDINCLKKQLLANPHLGDPNKVLLLPCHGSMASSEQKLIFDKPKNGARKIVLATNMAETSITIDDVVFVVDLGKAKETSYDALNNTPCLLPTWISKASARQRRGRAGRVQPGECYHLYPRCVYDVFAEFQLPELLRTPLQSLCLQIKSLKLGSINEFLSRALQSPDPLSVQNAIDYLKLIGALDESEDLTILGHHLSMLPVEPKLGKMLIYGAIFSCLDPILTIVSGLSVRDPFLNPSDKKDLAESAKSQFSCQDYSDHLALVRAHKGWNDAERNNSGHEYCSKNFLSAQTMKAIDLLRKQFLDILTNTGLIDENFSTCNKWSRDENLLRAVICAGLYPGVCSVINKEKSISLKTMEDGQVMLYSNSVNGREAKIPYPWLVFNEKVKVNSVFLRDSTGVSDSILLLFGGNVSRGLDGHLEMLGGYFEFLMRPELQSMYLILKRELNELILKKLVNPKMDLQSSEEILSAVRLLVKEDPFSGRFVFGHQEPIHKRPKSSPSTNPGSGGDNAKNRLQTMVTRAGHQNPVYKTKKMQNNLFISMVEFSGKQFVGQPRASKKLAEKDAAAGALNRLLGDFATS